MENSPQTVQVVTVWYMSSPGLTYACVILNTQLNLSAAARPAIERFFLSEKNELEVCEW